MSKDLITGAEALMRSLEHQGVTTIFGYPGGSIMPVFDTGFVRSSKYIEPYLGSPRTGSCSCSARFCPRIG